MIKPFWEYLDKDDLGFALLGLGIVVVALIVLFLLERKISKRRSNQNRGGT